MTEEAKESPPNLRAKARELLLKAKVYRVFAMVFAGFGLLVFLILFYT